MSEPAQPKGTQSAGPPVAAWLAAAVAAVGYASLRLSLGTEFQGASWEKLYALTAPRPYGHRVLPSLLARPLHGLGLPLAWGVLESLATFGLLLALAWALRALVSARLAGAGSALFLVFLAWPYLLAHRWHVFYPYDTPALAFVALGLGLALRERWWAMALVTAIAAANRETAVLIPAAAVLLGLGRARLGVLVRRVGPAALAFLAVRVAILLALPDLEGGAADLTVKGELRPLHNLGWLFDAADRPFVLLASMGWLPIIWFMLQRSITSPIRRLGALSVLVALGMAVVGNLYEPRVFGEAMLLAWVPIVVGLERWLAEERAT